MRQECNVKHGVTHGHLHHRKCRLQGHHTFKPFSPCDVSIHDSHHALHNTHGAPYLVLNSLSVAHITKSSPAPGFVKIASWHMTVRETKEVWLLQNHVHSTPSILLVPSTNTGAVMWREASKGPLYIALQ